LLHLTVICALKIGLSMVVSVVLYDVPGVFKVVFYPFRFLLAFHDPLHPEFKDELHEWFFRSNLDHLIWVSAIARPCL
jgi:N-acetylneuraminate 9-O-acetyltransferase